MTTTSTDAMHSLALTCSNVARIIVLAAAGLALGCSSVQLTYNSVPTLGTWWLNRYLDFDSTQSARLRDDLGELQRWHRHTQLPAMAELFVQAQALAAREQLVPTEVCALVEAVQQQFDTVAQQAEAGGAQLVLSLTTPAQLQHLQQRYAKSNRSFQKEWLDLSPLQLQAKRYDTALERAEQLYGRLSAEQRALVQRLVGASSFDPRALHDERLRRQHDALQTLHGMAQEPHTPQQAAAALRGLIARYRHSPNPQYRGLAQRLQEENCAGIAQLHRSATPAQRAHAQQHLRGYEKDVRALLAQR
jgi:hypothetical protein